MNHPVFLAALLVMACTSCQTTEEGNSTSAEDNKTLSTLYHERNLEDVDMLLDDDFVGSYYLPNETEPILWYKENHRNGIINNPNVRDSIITQVAEGDWVAERFIRTNTSEGVYMEAEVMQFKQFKDGKIIRSWEVFALTEDNSEPEEEVTE